MLLYLFTLLITTILGILAMKYGKTNKEFPKIIYPSSLFVWLLIILFVLISGFRYMNYYATDEYAYRLNYLTYLDKSFIDLWVSLDGEWGWGLLNWVLTRFTSNPQAIILISALITNILILRTLAKYAQPFVFSVFLYVAGGFYFASFNTMRQYLAMSIIFYGVKYIFEKKVLKYLTLIIIGASIHFTAWIMLPLYILVKRKRFDKMFTILLIASMIIILNFEKITYYLISDSNYKDYLNIYYQGVGGVNPLRVLAWVLPFLLIFISRKKIIEKKLISNIFFNYSILSAVTLLVSLAFIYVARIDVYFGIFNLITFTVLIKIFNKKVNTFLGFYILSFYFLYGLYESSKMEKYYNILFSKIDGLLF